MNIRKFFDRACNGAGPVVPSEKVDSADQYIRDCVPLRDVLTGVFNGSPIPPDYLGEPHQDTDDTPLHEVDPYASYGYSKLDREQYAMDQSALRVDAEGHRARTARARTAPRDGVLDKAPVDSTGSKSSAE